MKDTVTYRCAIEGPGMAACPYSCGKEQCAATPADELRWCNHCGEGVINMCRGKGVTACPMTFAATRADDLDAKRWKALHAQIAPSMHEWHAFAVGMGYDGVKPALDSIKKLRSALNAMLTEMGMDEDENNRPTFHQARRALESVPAPKEVGISASEAASDTEFCWLVELFLPEGNSLGSYHTGFTDLSGNSRSTPDPFKAKRYSKADAEAVAANLGHTLSGTWKAIEHGFATPPPAPQPSLPEQPHVYRDIFGNPAPDALQSVLRELDNKP